VRRIATYKGVQGCVHRARRPGTHDGLTRIAKPDRLATRVVMGGTWRCANHPLLETERLRVG